ncbi:hypothetical protein F2Q70_00039051 [Brassica cretica]|uniref:Uncharacterized protein n=1 Tax=Brassica cretica TaxID=69181 RepID=A0A8S9K5W4_BRACR|nr:hypothetical protein F2Q70_00039051 [Brassica cretica]
MYLVSPPGRFESPTPATAPFQPSIASSQVFMPPAIHLTSRQLHPTNGAKLHRSNRCLLVTARPIVQEYCFARVAHDYVTAASLSHYAVSSIDGSSQSRIGGLSDLLVAGTIVQECGLARFYNSITVASPSHYAIPSIDGSSQSQLCDLHTGFVARRSNHPEAFYLLSDVCLHMCWLNECDDCTLRSPSVTNCWAQHGNVEFREYRFLRDQKTIGGHKHQDALAGLLVFISLGNCEV